MLEGIRSNPIIAGAYTSGDGICPMLAAHRAGGRTSVIAFAKAWDRFAFRDARSKRARRASERELLILRSQLEASLLDDDRPSPQLGAAIAEHRELISRAQSRQSERREQRRTARRQGRARPGDPDRSGELGRRPGWGWLRVVRRYDDWQRALARIQSPGDPAERPDRDRACV